MTVWVLMENGDYDGDRLLGVYETAEEARAQGAVWSGDEYNGETFVAPVEIGAPPNERQTGIARTHEEERQARRRLAGS